MVAGDANQTRHGKPAARASRCASRRASRANMHSRALVRVSTMRGRHYLRPHRLPLSSALWLQRMTRGPRSRIQRTPRSTVVSADRSSLRAHVEQGSPSLTRSATRRRARSHVDASTLPPSGRQSCEQLQAFSGVSQIPLPHRVQNLSTPYGSVPSTHCGEPGAGLHVFPPSIGTHWEIDGRSGISTSPGQHSATGGAASS
jgi:hypothetical protein